MNLLEHLRTRARANRLANHRLYAAMSALPNIDYRAARTSFFPSLAATLEHLHAVDLYYVAALHEEADMESQWCAAPKGVTLADLAASQGRLDQRLIAHLDRIDDVALEQVIALDRGEGRVQHEQRGHIVAHLLDHQLHHRGQAHSMLASTSVRPPQLDEFLMPSEAHLRRADLAALGWTESDLFAHRV